jgi:hypothetical protein
MSIELFFLIDVIREKKQKYMCKRQANGLRYLRWGGDGEAVQLEK